MFMIKFIKSIARVAACVCLWASACGAAHADTLHFGPCEGQTSTKGYGKTGNGTISAAVVIPKEQLAKYAGARIKGVRIALITTEGMTDLCGWVRTSLTDKDIDSTPVAAPQTGWSEILFGKAGTVSGNEDLVVGYSFKQELTVKCMSVAGPTDKGGYWIAKDGGWTDKSGDKLGSLGIELVIEGDNVPATDLALTNTSFDEITEFGSTYNARFIVQNFSNSALKGYRYVCKIQDKTVAEGSVDKTIGSFGRDTVKLAIASDAVAKGVRIPVSLEVSAEGDGYPADNSATLYMSTYDDTNTKYFHNVLLEEFSTEECGNCPRAINTIEQCMEQGYDKSVIQVTHHAGYNYDFLSTPDDKTMLWFYGEDGSFAPAAMLDRLSDPICKQILSGKAGTPVMSVAYANTFAPALKYMTGRPAFVGVTPTCQYDAATRKLEITVDVEKDEVFDAQSLSPLLTVYIVQDSILHHHQAGYSSDTFKHRHVYRASVTPLFGEALTWDGNKAQAKYAYTLPDSIESSLFWEPQYTKSVALNPRDVEVVAFVSKYNADDPCDCTVFNSGVYRLKKDIPSSIGIVESDSKVVSTEYYSLDGIRSNTVPRSGMYIRRVRFSDGSEKTIKMVR